MLNGTVRSGANKENSSVFLIPRSPFPPLWKIRWLTALLMKDSDESTPQLGFLWAEWGRLGYGHGIKRVVTVS